jgi:hypothetical protein
MAHLKCFEKSSQELVIFVVAIFVLLCNVLVYKQFVWIAILQKSLETIVWLSRDIMAIEQLGIVFNLCVMRTSR